ncbi:MAG: tRNA (N(6)-L-threonylcarbamoyladenosine(37)-C(2))-methylthiotransferase MtaB, partial [Nitrospirota bacterium]
ETLSVRGGEAVASPDDADLQVIFTCTVTGKSDYQCRQEIRRAVKAKKSGGMVLVTGCYAQTAPDAIKEINGVDAVVGNEGRKNITDIIGGRFGFPAEKSISFSAQAIGGMMPVDRSRAFLKVQEGCDSFCSYCIVPYARGRSRSARPEDVLAKADELIARGYHEIVLTGVHLGAYGRDLGDMRLSGLVSALLDRPGLGRLRLSSVEPMEIDDALIELIGHEKLCRHFHVPLQSASDMVLASMGRGYSWGDYLAVVKRIESSAPGACIGADVIVGYPAEDADAFEETLKRVEDSPINYLHVFSYSPRKGTKAYGMGDPVTGDVKRERSERLRELGRQKNYEFRRSLVGNTMEVVAEEKDGVFSGLTDNYVRVGFEGENIPQGRPVKVKILGADGGKTNGVILEVHNAPSVPLLS